MRNARQQHLAIASLLVAAALLAGCSVSVATTTTTTGTPETTPSTESESESEVVRIIDGDSFELNIAGETVEARLAGVNAPELFDGANQRTCNGEQAKSALEDWVNGKLVTVVGSETDRFGRLLVDLFKEGRSLADTLVSDGWLLVTDDNLLRRQALRTAVDANAGMFGPTCGEANLDIGISSVRANPAGNDRENLTEELVELTNRSEQPVDLAGWVLRDETTGHIFELGPLFLDPGDKVKVRSGKGQDGENDVYLNESFPVWSNGYETVLLIDPKGVVAEVVFLIEVGE